MCIMCNTCHTYEIYDFNCVSIYTFIYTPAYMDVIFFQVNILGRTFNGIFYVEKYHVKVKLFYTPCSKLLPELSISSLPIRGDY